MTEVEDDADSPRTQGSNSSDKLALISEQRSALEEIVKISLAVSRLQHGLQAVLLLGKPTSQISSSYLKKYDALKTSISSQPNDKLEQSLEILDKYINSAMQKLIDIVDAGERNLSEHDSGSSTLDIIHENIHQELEDFRRKSQTAVVIRLLLRERGIKTQELTLVISEDIIVEKISDLHNKEKKCRKRIHAEIVVMEKTINSVLDNPSTPALVKEEMEATLDSLQKNLDHLLAGKPLDNLPIVFEIIEMGTEEDHKTAFTPTSLPAESPVDAPIIEKEVYKKKIKRSVVALFFEWVRTPTNVSWKDIDKYK